MFEHLFNISAQLYATRSLSTHYRSARDPSHEPSSFTQDAYAIAQYPGIVAAQPSRTAVSSRNNRRAIVFYSVLCTLHSVLFRDWGHRL